MKLLILLPFFLTLFLQTSLAATFIPISYEEQIRNSDAVVHAVFKDKTYKKIEEGQVVTVNAFKLIGSSGINHSAMVNKNNFKIITPGGEWNGRTYHFSGSPEFKKDEEVVLFLKKHPMGFRVMNLSLGKFGVENEGSRKFLKNTVFPHHPRMKVIQLQELQEKLVAMGKEKIGDLDQRQSYVPVLKDGSNNNPPDAKVNGRAPASKTNAEKNEEEESPVSMPMLFVVLVLVGFLFRYVSKKLT